VTAVSIAVFIKRLGVRGGGDKFNIAFAAAIAAGGTGAPTNTPGLMNSQVLAAYFGLTADPANQPRKPAKPA
jgi:hypothetical protein